MVTKEELLAFLRDFLKLTKYKFYFSAVIFIILQVVPNNYQCTSFCAKYFGFPFKFPIILIYNAKDSIASSLASVMLFGLLSLIANAIIVYLVVVTSAYIIKRIEHYSGRPKSAIRISAPVKKGEKPKSSPHPAFQKTAPQFKSLVPSKLKSVLR